MKNTTVDRSGGEREEAPENDLKKNPGDSRGGPGILLSRISEFSVLALLWA
ncbi:hypothetical protein [Sinomicrobium soli]|uniref:hypothetical protein n=1 Tax=Sinomicrobium sp. N-1-3-6 TaxID=2219864 RepID=UPI001374ADCF|nr:hypothetical protein [Sinomicrobium sp. N-1-3-6]